uniref:Inactive ubiquitin carboxylterminal hydrolase putati n=1 Tax=Albugo laibachii Nc14 TaxID=890382 RepID=F0WJH2_9STRA|nr:inactive ubiquitin carboxylterminal hydrolase putati [Albugo laibachii Nc14]|eukprot:CCA21421.1 inactive ubiquitin carboxylterminal hydrolase putati [Albugo laibachii Nc14]
MESRSYKTQIQFITFMPTSSASYQPAASVGPTKHCMAPFANKSDEILCHGWLHLKTRSMMNVRPRHFRYCVVYKNDDTLLTFRFQPSSQELVSVMRPLRKYCIKNVREWNLRKSGFFLTVIKSNENVERVLEITLPSSSVMNEWRRAFSNITEPLAERKQVLCKMTASLEVHTSIDAPLVETKQPNFWVKGASIHRGLLNNTGENNCFLNVIIQSFWHLQPMRHFLLNAEIKNDIKSVATSVLRALQTIMIEYDDTSSGLLHSRGLRKGLSVLYKADKNFQEGMMYDAEETLLALLNLMHQQTNVTELDQNKENTALVKTMTRLIRNDAYNETPPTIFDQHSIPHVVFSHQMYDRFVCGACQHATSWELSSNLVFTTYASDFLDKSYPSMEEMLRHVSSSETTTLCSSGKCSGRNQKERSIYRFPMVFTISILWSTASASSKQVETLMSNISSRLDLAGAFVAGGPAANLFRGGIRTTYRLRGFVCYYGKHYVAVFYSTTHKIWLLFDDSRVLEIGSWSQVVAKCLKGRSQPVLLFYELPDRRKDSSVNIIDEVHKMPSSSKSWPVGSLDSVQEVIHESVELTDATVPQNPEDHNPSVSESETVTIQPTKNQDRELSGVAFESFQDITPVSSAIAVQPRLAAMRAPLQANEYDVTYTAENRILGLHLAKFDGILTIIGFPRDSSGDKFGAELSGQIRILDSFVHANGHSLHHYSVKRAIQMLKAQQRPLIIRLKRSTKTKSLREMGFSQEMATNALLESKGDMEVASYYCIENA